MRLSKIFMILCGVLLIFSKDLNSAQNLLSKSIQFSGSGELFIEGSHVATLKMPKMPDSDSFILRGTVPMPAKHYPGVTEFGHRSFAVEDVDGNLIPAQVEIVTRYPDGKHADVVEILARVKRGLLEYKVKEIFFAQKPREKSAQLFANLPESIANLVANPEQVYLHAQDFFGNHYIKPIFPIDQKVNFTKLGGAAVQIKHHDSLTPVPGFPNTLQVLPKLFSFHTIATVWDQEEFVSIDMWFHNGLAGEDPKNNPDKIHKVYFRSLDLLLLDENFTALQAFEDPFFGDPELLGTKNKIKKIPIVKPNPDGTMHVFPKQAQFHRRLMLTPKTNQQKARAFLEMQGQAFVAPGLNDNNTQELFSWWNPKTARYFPQKGVLPRLDHLNQSALHAGLTSRLEEYVELVKTGENHFFPVISKVLGWAHPESPAYGGVTGGHDIGSHFGIKGAWVASVDDLRFRQLHCRMKTDRQPIALFKSNGDPLGLEDMLRENAIGKYVPFDFFHWLLTKNSAAYFGTNLPSPHEQEVAAAGQKPLYEDSLLNFDPHDQQHLCRYTNDAKVLVCQSNDTIAKLALQLEADAGMLSYHQYFNSAGGYIQDSGLLADINHVTNFPQRGISFGRGEAWVVDAVNATYAFADDTWRQEARPWYDAIVSMLQKAQIPCTGLIRSTINTNKLYDHYYGREVFQDNLNQLAMRGAFFAVYQGTGALQEQALLDILTGSYYSVIAPIAWGWGPNLQNPKYGSFFKHAVSHFDLTLEPFCDALPADGGTPFVDNYYILTYLAYGYEITGDKKFLEEAVKTEGSMEALKNKLKFGNNLDNEAALLALMQDLDWEIPEEE